MELAAKDCPGALRYVMICGYTDGFASAYARDRDRRGGRGRGPATAWSRLGSCRSGNQLAEALGECGAAPAPPRGLRFLARHVGALRDGGAGLTAAPGEQAKRDA